jgi:hypothetical protein
MKPHKIAKFKADSMNQLQQKKPVTFFILMFALAFCAVSVTQDILYIWFDSPDYWKWIPRRYIIGLGAAIGAFLGTRDRWKWVKKEEANNQIQNIGINAPNSYL